MTQVNIAEVAKEIRTCISGYNKVAKTVGVSDAIVCGVTINRQWEKCEDSPRGVVYVSGLAKPDYAHVAHELVRKVAHKYGMNVIGVPESVDNQSLNYTLIILH